MVAHIHLFVVALSDVCHVAAITAAGSLESPPSLLPRGFVTIDPLLAAGRASCLRLADFQRVVVGGYSKKSVTLINHLK